MECTKIKELLSEYIDQALDFKTRELVKEHLTSCKDCLEELSTLENCIRNVSSLKGVQAPEDFLQRVHERIERRFEFERIMRKLFIPAKVKIPLEFAGVLATVVLVIMVYRVIQPLGPMQSIPVMVKPEESKQRTIAIPKEEISQGYRLGTTYEGGGLLEGGYVSTREGYSVAGAAPGFGQSLSRGITQYSIENALKSPYKGEEEFLKIKDIIESLQGTVIFVWFEKETNLLESINVRIPSQNYSKLLEKLKEIGISEESQLSVISKDEEFMEVSIKLIPSQ